MARSYIGIVSSQGLVALCPEDSPFAALRSRPLPSASAQTACCWAVLDDEAADEIVRCLRASMPQAALETLSCRAENAGAWQPAAVHAQ